MRRALVDDDDEEDDEDAGDEDLDLEDFLGCCKLEGESVCESSVDEE